MKLSPAFVLVLLMIPALSQACVVLPTVTAAEMTRLKEQAGGGDVAAMDKLAYLYEVGNYEGGKQDYAEAVKWWRQATDKGDLEAEHRLAEKYEEGRGVPKDMDKAISLYRDAADKGEYWSQLAMMVAYMSGQGEKKELAQAYMWTLVSDKNPNRVPKDSPPSAPYFTKEMTPEQVALAKRLALEWKPKQPYKVAESQPAKAAPPPDSAATPSKNCE